MKTFSAAVLLLAAAATTVLAHGRDANQNMQNTHQNNNNKNNGLNQLISRYVAHENVEWEHRSANDGEHVGDAKNPSHGGHKRDAGPGGEANVDEFDEQGKRREGGPGWRNAGGKTTVPLIGGVVGLAGVMVALL